MGGDSYPFFDYVIELMASESEEIAAMALRFVSQTFSIENEHLVNVALQHDVLNKYKKMLGCRSA